MNMIPLFQSNTQLLVDRWNKFIINKDHQNNFNIVPDITKLTLNILTQTSFGFDFEVFTNNVEKKRN